MTEANTQQKGTQDEVAKIIACLIENGSTPSGRMLDFWDLERRTGIEAIALYRVVRSVIDVTDSKKLLEADPMSEITSRSAEERIGQRERANRPFKVGLRLSEVGLRLAKEEFGVQYQYKQLGDFDAAVERSRQSSNVSKVGLAISALSMLIAGISLLRTCRTDMSQQVQTAPAIESAQSSHQGDTGLLAPIMTDTQAVQVTH